jgi:NAD+ kinase
LSIIKSGKEIMTIQLKSVGIIFKHDFEPARMECQRLKKWFKTMGVNVFTEEMTSKALLSQCLEEETSIPESVDLVIVLGGDGTLLGAARKIGRYGLPILGINLGGLGFITEVPLKNLYKDIKKIIEGETLIFENRLMLEARVMRGDEEKCVFSVLNDVVINKAALARIIDLSVSINDTFLTTFKADGLIISSPTGSTGYNLSAGGPILYPNLEALILTPICPFTLAHRPIILPDTSTIEITVGENSEEVTLTFDGQVGFDFMHKDRLIVSKSNKKLKLIKSPSQNYFEILRTKLKWGESSHNNGN